MKAELAMLLFALAALLPCSDAAIAAASHPHELVSAILTGRGAEGGEGAEGDDPLTGPCHHLTIDHKMMGVRSRTVPPPPHGTPPPRHADVAWLA